MCKPFFYLLPKSPCGIKSERKEKALLLHLPHRSLSLSLCESSLWVEPTNDLAVLRLDLLTLGSPSVSVQPLPAAQNLQTAPLRALSTAALLLSSYLAMDAKALAKSKRAHSEHHSKKYHPNPKAKSAAVGGGKGNEAGTAKNPLGKQVQEKTHPTKGASALPSNWDRYEEELDLGSEDPVPAADGSNRAPDVVIPKSKGADFCHLIDEARSQSQSFAYSDTFPGLENDLLGEWNKGIETMLSVRGESVLSRIGDDNFVVEDKNAAAPHEVSFLSLNLHSLAEQLEKIDLPQRLFIEADLLPPELYAEQATCGEEAARRLPEESPCSDFSEEVQVPDHDIEIKISDSPTDPKLGKSEYEHKLPESETQISVKSFEPSTAEAELELDLLLDSFGETKINDSTAFESRTTFSVQVDASLMPIQPRRKVPDSSATIDDELDELINETSILINQGGLSQPQEQRAAHDSQSSSISGTKSKEVDDFDSWLDTI
ncbi:hypothetical protein ACFX19_017407 [Malus domestica]